MSILSGLFDAGGSGIAKLFSSVMDEIKLSPEKKADVELAMAQHQADLAKMENDLEMKLVDVAGQNIRAETESEDHYTSRARPSFLYMMEAVLAINYVVFPLLGKAPLVFPDALFWLFGSCMLGYTGARSWEKYAGAATPAGK